MVRLQVPHAEAEHQRSADQAVSGAGIQVRAQRRGGDDVVYRRRAGQGSHRERPCAEADRSREQALGNPCLFDQAQPERVNREQHDEDDDTAVGQHGGRKNDDPQRTVGPKPARERHRDARGGVAVGHRTAEDGPGDEQQEEAAGESERADRAGRELFRQCIEDVEPVGQCNDGRRDDRGHDDVGPAQRKKNQQRQRKKQAAVLDEVVHPC
jgi:hypothetical protein